MPPQRAEVEMGWGSVSYLRWSPEAAEPLGTVLLLHGGGMDSAELSWGEVGPALAAAGHQVIAPDHPGYGHSPPASWSHTQERLVRYVAEFADRLDLVRFGIGGFSLGGGLAIGFALGHPGRVTRAALLASYGFSPRLAGSLAPIRQAVSWAAVRTVLPQLYAPLNSWLAAHPAALSRVLAPLVRDPARRTPELLAAVAEEIGRHADEQAFAQFQRSEVGFKGNRTDYTADLGEFAVPALIVQGDRDPGISVARAQRAAETIPDARLLLLPGAGHWVHRDRPAEVESALVAFFAEPGWSGPLGAT